MSGIDEEKCEHESLTVVIITKGFVLKRKDLYTRDGPKDYSLEMPRDDDIMVVGTESLDEISCVDCEKCFYNEVYLLDKNDPDYGEMFDVVRERLKRGLMIVGND